MELFEQFVLTVLMMYIGVKKAIALTKKIQQNASVIASRLEIEEKSRGLEIKKTTLHLESRIGVVPNTCEVNAEMSPKISKIDISWPKDIIEDDSKHFRIRTPSVPEIEEIISEISEHVIVKIQDETPETPGKTSDDIGISSENQNVVENVQKTNIPKSTSSKVKFSERGSIKFAVSNGNLCNPIRTGSNIEHRNTNEINRVISPTNFEKPIKDDLVKSSSVREERESITPVPNRDCETEIKTRSREVSNENETTSKSLNYCALDEFKAQSIEETEESISNSEVNSKVVNTKQVTIVDSDLPKKENNFSEGNINIKTEIDRKETPQIEIKGKNRGSDIKTEENLKAEEIFFQDEESAFQKRKDIQDNVSVNESRTNRSVVANNLTCRNESNLEDEIVKVESNVQQNDEPKEKSEYISLVDSGSNNGAKSIIDTFDNEDEPASDDISTNSYFDTALDSSTISGDLISDTTNEVSSIKSSTNNISDNNLNKGGKSNVTNESLLAINTNSLNDNTVYLCSAKCREETSVGNHLVLCADSGVVLGNSDLGQTVHATSTEEDDEIYYNATSEVDSKPFWLIFSGEYTKAMNKDWHSGHFCCWQCDESLTGQRYVLRDDHPYCIKCYESVFANPCEECNKTIGIDSKDLSYKDKHWHEACFLCNKCHVSLVDKQFGSKADKIYCGNCYDTQFASRCDGCTQIFRAGTKKMEYKTRQWHEQCFCCCVCKSPIGTKSFIPREQEIYCATCYEEKFSTRCVKCNKIITSGGVTYKNEPWHRECFTCTKCDTSLAGQRFTSRDEKPYCADCFGELFAKRCTACCKPITGIGGTRFISFEDRHWHNDCFICASCKTSLVGRGFITDGDDIICPDCAKAKLM